MTSNSAENLGEFVFVEFSKHLNGYNKCLGKPLKVISCGFLVYSDKEKIALAQALYSKAKKPFSDVKVVPNYKIINNIPIEVSENLCTITFKDTMWISKSSSIEKLRKWKPSTIKSKGFLIAEKGNAYIIAFMYVPKKDKYSEISIIPKVNVLEVKKV